MFCADNFQGQLSDHTTDPNNKYNFEINWNRVKNITYAVVVAVDAAAEVGAEDPIDRVKPVEVGAADDEDFVDPKPKPSPPKEDAVDVDEAGTAAADPDELPRVEKPPAKRKKHNMLFKFFLAKTVNSVNF